MERFDPAVEDLIGLALREDIGALAQSEEDVLTFAMFPEIGRDFLDQRASGQLTPEPLEPPVSDQDTLAGRPTEFNVTLIDIGDKKIQVIKAVREVTSLGLKEAKDLVDNSPKPVKEGISKEEAEAIKAKLEEQGATFELK